ncbi:Oxalate oxidase [Mycena venus]|uniref:Oxalate oxidase n=1 Tax=Mycena venus TaxID=2733690 RepID=A0A8H6X6S3_9AGAR|nr:Oxalate oxidase [Mycena venus]
MISVSSCLCALLLSAFVSAAPAPAASVSAAASAVSDAAPASATSSSTFKVPAVSSTSSAAEPSATVPFAGTEPNNPLWNLTSGTPEPIRGALGAPILGTDINLPIEQENPDVLAPPTTDAGDVKNAKWPLDLSHMRLQTGGWSRQENTDMLPIGTAMAAVDMRLEAGAIRELHWHTASEWAYVLAGWTQISAVDQDGRNFLATVGPGDLWFFPPGIPHSLQATNQTEGGSEFLLVFDNGAFSDDGTFLLTDWMSHVPYEVIMKNFQANKGGILAHSQPAGGPVHLPWPSDPNPNALPPTDPQGQIPNPYAFPLSQVNARQLPGGTIKIADSTNFTVSNTIAVAEITVQPGAMRELHVRPFTVVVFILGVTLEMQWHPTMDEMDFFLEGEARMTLFAAEGNARTFDYQPGDIGYVPNNYGHYIENTGNTRTEQFQDLSLNQWLALTPPEIVKAHLQLSDETIASLMKVKPIVI